MWETSIRVPLLMRWPSVVKPGTSIDTPVSNLDMYRTVLGGLNVSLPDGCQADGIDYSPLLRGEEVAERNALFGQYDLHNGGLAYMRMIRTPQYKLVRHFHANQMDELYDLVNDPDENRNLIGRNRGEAGKHAAVIQDLQRQLTQWQQAIDDPILRDNY